MIRAGRLGLVLLLSWWTLQFLAHPMRQDVIGASFLHVISIPFHEAGHIFFAPFGDLMTALGGSLAQILVPIICCAAFLTSSPSPFGAAVTAWWAGENMLDVAIYINDARALKLILLGGHTGAEVEGHDWEHILQLTGLLRQDHRIAWAVHVAGAIVMIAALAWGFTIAIQGRDEERWERV